MSLAETHLQPRGHAPLAKRAKAAPKPKPRTLPPKQAQDRPENEAVTACREAAQRCACVIAGFFQIAPDQLFKSTRGAAREAFPRQLMMAGLVSELGFAAAIVGEAVGRDTATVEHACRIVEALRGGLEACDLVQILGEDGCREYLGGGDQLVVEYRNARGDVVAPEIGESTKHLVAHVIDGGDVVEEFIESAEGLVDDLFAAFQLVAVRGAAYCADVRRMMVESVERRNNP